MVESFVDYITFTNTFLKISHSLFDLFKLGKEEMSCPALKGGKSKLGDILNGVDKKGI